MKKENKTLKDLKKKEIPFKWKTEGMTRFYNGISTWIEEEELKAEAIKWVKEDKYFLSKSKNDLNNGNIILERWMKRLNTTEEDLI